MIDAGDDAESPAQWHSDTGGLVKCHGEESQPSSEARTALCIGRRVAFSIGDVLIAKYHDEVTGKGCCQCGAIDGAICETERKLL